MKTTDDGSSIRSTRAEAVRDDHLCIADAIATRIPIVGMPPGMQLNYKGSPIPAVKAAETMFYRACASQQAHAAQDTNKH